MFPVMPRTGHEGLFIPSVQNADRVQNADCRLQTGYKMQTADCRPGTKCRLS